MPMMAVTGASRVFSALPGDMHGTSNALASGVVTKMMRIGLQLAEVGPHFASS